MPAELWIYDVIGQDWFGEGVTAKKVRDQVKEIGPSERIRVRLNTPGGDVFEAAAIYTILAQHPAGVDTQIDGLAASCGSYLSTVGETVTISDGGMIMIHNPWTITMGDASEHRGSAELLDKIAAQLGEAYVKKSGKSAEEIAALMTAETWFTSDEAIEFGLADEKVATAAKAFNIPKEFGFKNQPKFEERRSKSLPKRAAAMARQIQLARSRTPASLLPHLS